MYTRRTILGQVRACVRRQESRGSDVVTVAPLPASARRANGGKLARVKRSALTQIVNRAEQGDAAAAAQLLPLVYDELRKLAAQRLAQEKAGQTLQATALVHEAYLRLVDVNQVQHWCGRGHFFAAAAEAMRRILIDNARRKHRIK